jgi:putative ABC transport system permease protein
MDAFIQDLRYAFRQLFRNPGFAAVAVGTLALGIGATASIFSVVNGILLRPLPYPDADRIVRVLQEDAEGRRMNNFSEPNFLDVRERSRSFDAIAQFSGTVVSVAGGDEPTRVVSATVSEAFFRVFGVEPFLGRGFLPEEQVLGGPSAVIVSHGYWERYLGGDPDLTGQLLRFGDQVYPVVGVMPSGFAFPTSADLWVPRESLPAETSRTAHNWQVVGRLAPDRSVAQTGQELEGIARALKEVHGEDTWMSGAAAVPLRTQVVERVRPALFLLAGAAGFLLLLVCANVVNLLLVRASARRQELSVRLALGAPRRRFVGQFVTEAMALCLLGGIGGVFLALWGLDGLLALGGGALPRSGEVRVDATVLVFTLGVSVAAAVGLGLLTAWRAAGADVRPGLASAGPRGGTPRPVLARALASAQVALALVLLIGAGLLGRSFLELVKVDPGFRTGGAVVMNVSLPYPGEDEAPRLAHFHQEVIDRLAALPGVTAVGGASDIPMGGNYANGTFVLVDHAEQITDFEDFGRLARDPARTGYAEFRVASPGYFAAMGIPLVRGRLLDEHDLPDDTHVAVISESFARAQWPGEDPLGRLVQFGNMDGDLRPFTIVGVVGDIREDALEAEPRPTLYGHFAQRPRNLSNFNVVAAGSGDPAATVAAAREIVASLDPDVPPSFRTLEEVFGAALSERRFHLILLATFGSTALLLALMGIYGVVSFSVSRRTRELGVRMALGAPQGSVVGLVLREGFVLAGTGIVVGLIGAMLLSHLVRGFLYGVGAWDPLTFAAVALVLLTVALAATVVPARRAARVDPMIAMRAE